MRRVHVVVSGLVQGVGFRYFVWRRAEALGVTGWVRNRRDGSVEAEVEGTPTTVEAMLTDLTEGPSGAVVRHVQVLDLRPQGDVGFAIRH